LSDTERDVRYPLVVSYYQFTLYNKPPHGDHVDVTRSVISVLYGRPYRTVDLDVSALR
jgi:hypothetical protein